MIHSFMIRVLQSNKRTVFTLLLMGTTLLSTACEICGCSINGYHFGILPQFKKNFIGVRYHYRSFNSQHLISEQLHILGNTSTEYFNSVELWSRWHVGKRIQLFAFMPFNHFRQVEMGTAVKASGIGDITLAGYYTLYNDAANKDKVFKQTLQAGGGIKLPSGKFIASGGSQQLNPSINTGSGSVDFLVNTLYSCRYKRLGISAEANVRLNSENNDHFQYGHRFTGAARIFYWKDLGKKISVLPNAGMMVETAAKDAHYQQKQQFSGGTTTSFISGIDWYMGKWNWSMSYHLPIQQNMSQNLVHLNAQFSTGLTYIF